MPEPAAAPAPAAKVTQGSSAPALAGWLLPLLLIGVGLAAYYNSFEGAFILDDNPRIVNNPQIRQLWPLWEVDGPEFAPDPATLAGAELRRRRREHVGVPRRQSRRSYSGRPAAVRHRAPDARERQPPRPLRRGVALAGRGGGGHLARPPAADRERHLHHPARRVADGAVLPAHAVLRHSRLSVAASASMGHRGRPRLRARHGQQGGDGVGADPDVALRPHVRLAGPSARSLRRRWGLYAGWPPPGSSWGRVLAPAAAEEQSSWWPASTRGATR